ncbi:unnamed protein product [Mytilus coruscus]|uniref:Integrase catalytic domain-containing protein n=1 Tax=Mytilus coruscus TaxID=42192 RepID=A0A6J8DZZ2_MYTCO|nr:unnamed protein product [Mytilus coruscus]
MSKQDIIEPSTSPWNSNIVLVKKSDDSWRFCIDFRSVNLLVLRPSYPLPCIDDTIDSLSGSKFFSTVDLKSGYYKISVAKEDRPKTAFSFPGGGLWQFKRMPIGLCNSAPVFERLMETVLSGHIVSSKNGVATDPNKIQSVKDKPVPKSIKDVRRFLRLTSYYRKFILKYANKAKPLYKVTEKNQKFVWTDDCQQSFEELKTSLISALFILDTDASNVGMGAVLSQLQDGVEKVIYYFSKTFSRSERKYFRRELLAVVASIKHFHHYLYGKYFKVRSDHGALSWLFNFKNSKESQLSDDVISIIIQWKIDEVKPSWADVSHMSPEVKFHCVNNNRYLMVVQDYFSKWTEAIPIPDIEAVTVAKKFEERIVTIFGVPLSIHSDQGSNFESHVFKKMCNILGIHKTRTTPFRPKSDGMVEKSNSTIETMLSAFVSKHQRDWDEYIYLLMLAYRSSEHESLGTSPCSILFGREVNLPVNLILGRPETEKSPFNLKTVYAYELSQKFEVTVYTCGICHDFTFDQSIKCKRHMTAQHSGFGWRCEECRMVVSRRAAHKKCDGELKLINLSTMTCTKEEEDQFLCFKGKERRR